MSGATREIAEIKNRLTELETTVNKSSFSAGLEALLYFSPQVADKESGHEPCLNLLLEWYYADHDIEPKEATKLYIEALKKADF